MNGAAPEAGVLGAALNVQYRNRVRAIVFGRHAQLFRDPAWDMLIEAFVADGVGSVACIKTLTAAAEVPASTGLRWIRQIEEAGFVERAAPGSDRRISVLRITAEGRRYVAAYLARL